MNVQSNPHKPIALIVEDEPYMSDMFINVFEIAGFKTICAYNGQDALKVIRTHHPDVVLADIHLPKMMGDELFNQIKDEPRFRDVSTIIVSADSRRASFLQDSADFVLLKPISFEQLNQLAKRIYSLVTKRPHFPSQDVGHLPGSAPLSG